MRIQQLYVPMIVGAAVLVLAATSATAVPITTGSTFSSGVVDYAVISNNGFGTTATAQPSTNGFDLDNADLASFVFLNDNTVMGDFIFTATGQDLGALQAVLDNLNVILNTTIGATGGGLVQVNASVDITQSTVPSDLVNATTLVQKNDSSGFLPQGSTYNYDETWALSDFTGMVGDPIQMTVDISVSLFASGIGSSELRDGMFGVDAALVPSVPVPEPGTALLLGLGLVSLGASRRRS